MSNSIFSAYGALQTAKAMLPSIIANRLPLLFKDGDVIRFEGFNKDDFPRYGGDVQYSVGPETGLKCIGWCYGKYDKDGNFVRSRNLFGKIFYLFEGRNLIDNSTFIKHPKEDERQEGIHLFNPDDLDPNEKICRDELGLPNDAEIRLGLNYPDSDDIQRRELLASELASFAVSRTPAGENAHEEYDYIGTYEDPQGTFKTVDAKIAVGEDILLARVLRTQSRIQIAQNNEEPTINYYWTLESKRAA